MTVSKTVCVGSTPAVPANLKMIYGGMGELENSMVCETIIGGGRTRISPQLCQCVAQLGECQVGSLEAAGAGPATLTNHVALGMFPALYTMPGVCISPSPRPTTWMAFCV